jgi:hypothetical protein
MEMQPWGSCAHALSRRPSRWKDKKGRPDKASGTTPSVCAFRRPHSHYLFSTDAKCKAPRERSDFRSGRRTDRYAYCAFAHLLTARDAPYGFNARVAVFLEARAYSKDKKVQRKQPQASAKPGAAAHGRATLASCYGPGE